MALGVVTRCPSPVQHTPTRDHRHVLIALRRGGRRRGAQRRIVPGWDDHPGIGRGILNGDVDRRLHVDAIGNEAIEILIFSLTPLLMLVSVRDVESDDIGHRRLAAHDGLQVLHPLLFPNIWIRRFVFV